MDGIRNNALYISVVATIGTAGLLTGYIYAKWKLKKSRPDFIHAGKVELIQIFPIKSCRPIEVKEADVGPLGISHNGIRDRVFVITDEKYSFLTARKENRLVLIQPSYHGDKMWLDAPGMDTVKFKIPVGGVKVRCRIWGTDSFGLDCGKVVATWIEDFMKRKPGTIHLLYHPWKKTVRVPPVYNWERFTPKDASIFADLCPALIVAQSSICDLNKRLVKEKQVSALNFRANIVVDGTHPYDEDFWTHVKIGDKCSFRCVRPCTRCILTTVNPETGIHTDEPLKTLKTYRQIMDPKHRKYNGESPRMGVYLGSDILGKIRIGDALYVAYC